MSLGLLLPSALVALLALAVPLLLHLVRQTEQARIDFAAMRWLRARARPRRRPRFDEWRLLVVRLLLLAIVALWLARPVLGGHPDLRSWVVVDPAIDATRGHAHLPRQAPKDATWHWLAPGFPAIDAPAPRSPASIASLLRELDATLPTGVALTAIVTEQFDATDAQRPVLGRAITWTVVAGTSAFSAADGPKPMRIAAFTDDAHRPSLRYLHAAAAAWASQAKASEPQDSLRDIAGPDALDAADTHLLWLASTAVPAQPRQWVQDGGVILLAQDGAATSLDWQHAHVAWRGTDGQPLALRLTDGKGAWIRMLVPFTPGSLPDMLGPGFPRALKDALQADEPIATRAWADSYAPKVNAQMAPALQARRPLDGLLAWLVALLFGIERWLAMSSRRWRSA